MEIIKRFFIIIFLFIFYNIYSHDKYENLEIEILNNDTYIINYWLEFDINAEEFLGICFYNEHICKYTNKIFTIDLIEEKNNKNKIKYNLHIFFYYNYSIFERELDKTDYIILFNVSDFKQNIKLLPNILKSNGYYKISNENNKNILHYYQITQLDKTISQSYLNFSKHQIKVYFNNLKKYINNYNKSKKDYSLE